MYGDNKFFYPSMSRRMNRKELSHDSTFHYLSSNPRPYSRTYSSSILTSNTRSRFRFPQYYSPYSTSNLTYINKKFTSGESANRILREYNLKSGKRNSSLISREDFKSKFGKENIFKSHKRNIENEEFSACSSEKIKQNTNLSTNETNSAMNSDSMGLKKLLKQSVELEKMLAVTFPKERYHIPKDKINYEIKLNQHINDCKNNKKVEEKTKEHKYMDECKNEFTNEVETIPKRKKRVHIPNEMIWEIIQFVPLNDVGKLGTVNYVFASYVAPRVQHKIQLLREQIDRTKKQLDDTNEQITTRQQQISQLNWQIVQMNERLGDMNGRLASMHSEIARSHQRIDGLLQRLRNVNVSFDELGEE